MPFQSTHPARGATFNLGHNFGLLYVISIHAPREGCDPTAGRGRYLRDNFNPRTPRGVRLAPHAGGGAAILISIHAPREGCDFAPRNDGGMWVISIHAPREGCDHRRYPGLHGEPTFQSTHPARGATITSPYFPVDGAISIHAPREGCDTVGIMLPVGYEDFNPRTPRGVRREAHYDWSASYIISIHAPREGCDLYVAFKYNITEISIHAPREGCDGEQPHRRQKAAYFNPRTPRGVRPAPHGV